MKWQDAPRLEAHRTDFCPDCSDEELVECTKAGDWAAFEQLVSRYQDQFFRLAAGYFNNEADAEDTVQVAFLKIYRKLDTFRGEAPFKSWAYRIVVNTALSRIRKEKRRREVALEDLSSTLEPDEALLHLTRQPTSTTNVSEDRELRERIAEAVTQLEPKYRSIFLLHETEGLSLDQISHVVELTPAGVKSRLHRARLFLRASLERYVEATGRLGR